MRKFISILALSFILFASACQSNEELELSNDEPYTVVTSFYPLYFFTSEIVGDVEGVELINLIPSGAEPHSYEPSPSQLAQMESASLIVAQGSGLEPWLSGLSHELEHDGVNVLVVNDHLDLMSYEDDHHEEHEEHEDEHDEHEEHEDEHDEHEEHEDEHDEHEEHEDEHDEHEEHEEHEDEHDDHKDHNHGEYDPHTWLDPNLAIEIVKEIEAALSDMDPSNQIRYAENAQNLRSRLINLDLSFTADLKDCSIDAFITSHDAFAYLAAAYGLEVYSVAGISPFDEPSASQLKDLIEIAEEEALNHIYFEVLANTEAATVLADEAGLESLVLNPVAGLSQDQEEEDYFTLMEENLNNLTIGLSCE